MSSASTLTRETWKQLDRQLRRVDEDRWLSSRYAARPQREALIALYLFNYELARVRLVVSEATLGAIRFQWWRDAVAEISHGEVRRHDVVMALGACMARGQLKAAALVTLIDRHEAAYAAGDRALEPEARLTGMAAQVFASVHGWGESIQAVAPHWAGLRRGENIGYGPVVGPAPASIRPAVAHLRIRRIMARKGAGQGRFAKRLSVLAGVMFGSV